MRQSHSYDDQAVDGRTDGQQRQQDHQPDALVERRQQTGSGGRLARPAHHHDPVALVQSGR